MEEELTISRTVDYDDNGYDYRTFWNGRDYELWAENKVLGRCLPKLAGADWFADFGGGFGRNADHYLAGSKHAVLMDYSRTNLTNAAQARPEAVRSGKLYLVRCDLNKIPFRDNAFDAAMVIRVLHHLPDMPKTVGEMARTVGSRWLVDVPIKHHLLGIARAAVGRKLGTVLGPDPVSMGKTDELFWNFRLDVVRRQLADFGFDTSLAASVNNLRRWDQKLPQQVVSKAQPVVRGVELVVQRAGRGWWGPSQFLIATRNLPRALTPAAGSFDDLPEPLRDLAVRTQCPDCRGDLGWTTDDATCTSCSRKFLREGDFWNFVSE